MIRTFARDKQILFFFFARRVNVDHLRFLEPESARSVMDGNPLPGQNVNKLQRINIGDGPFGGGGGGD